MKFILEFLPDAAGIALHVDMQFELARGEFQHLGATVSRVELDAHFVAPGHDSPYAIRPYADDAVVVDIPDLGVLCRYLEETGRSANLMAGSAWETTGGGKELLKFKMFVAVDGFVDRELR